MCSKHYSAAEIRSMIMTGYFGDNSLYLSLKYKNKDIKDVPFVETMDVAVQSNDTIKITVYEKALAGYVEYLGRFMYFDNKGVVVEASKVITKGIPQITGTITYIRNNGKRLQKAITLKYQETVTADMFL